MTALTFFVEQFSTPTGPMILLTDDAGAARALDWRDHEERMLRLMRLGYGADIANLVDLTTPSRARRAIEAYFEGDRCALDAVVVETRGTLFQRELWRALRSIPWGRTSSYGALAVKLGRPKAMRAVGAANGANPVAIIQPCHRVIGADGSLTGFGGGIERKRWLLAHEGAIPPGATQPNLDFDALWGAA